MRRKPTESPATILRKAQIEARNNHWESALSIQIAAEQLDVPEKHYRFHLKRKWEFDFAWPKLMVAVEVDGGSMGVRCGTCRGMGLVPRFVVYGLTRKTGFRTTGHLVCCSSCGGNRMVAGRHTQAEGFEADHVKINEAQALGWRVYRFTPGMIERGEAVAFLAKNLIRRTP